MRHGNLVKLISLACCIALAPLTGAVAADPSVQDEATAEDAHWLAAVSASRVARNGTSLTGRIPGGARHAK